MSVNWKPQSEKGKKKKQSLPGTSGHLHTGIESRLTLKVIHDYAVVTTDDMLVDAFPTEMLKDFVDAVNAVQNGLENENNGSMFINPIKNSLI